MTDPRLLLTAEQIDAARAAIRGTPAWEAGYAACLRHIAHEDAALGTFAALGRLADRLGNPDAAAATALREQDSTL